MRFSKFVLGAALLMCYMIGNMATAHPQLPKPEATPLQELDEIVARVNGEIITQTEFSTAYQITREQQIAAQANFMPAVTDKKLKAIVLEQLIAQKIQLQMAKQQGITVSDEQLDSAIDHIAKEHQVTTAQLYEEVEKTGLSKATYRKQIRNQLVIMTLQRGVVGGQAMVTPAETKAYQEAHSANVYQVGDILIPLSNEPSQHTLDQASKKAEEIKQALSQSKNFLDTANKYAPNNHTVLDWSPLTDLPDVFANTIQATRVNDAAGPVRAQNGLHVLYLLGKKKNTQALPEKQVEMMLYQEKAEKIISPWLKKLRDTSDIQIIGSV